MHKALLKLDIVEVICENLDIRSLCNFYESCISVKEAMGLLGLWRRRAHKLAALSPTEDWLLEKSPKTSCDINEQDYYKNTCVTYNKYINIRNPKTCETVIHPDGGGYIVSNVAVSESHLLLSAFLESEPIQFLLLWDISSKQCVTLFQTDADHEENIYSLDVLNKFAVSGSGDTIRVFDVVMGKECCSVESREGLVDSLRLVPGEQHVLSAHHEGDLVIWRIVKTTQQTEIQYQNRIVNTKATIYFDLSSLFLTTCRYRKFDRYLKVYDLKDLLSHHPKHDKKQELAPPSNGFVNSVSIKDKILTAVSSFSIITLWRTEGEGPDMEFELFLTFRYLGMKSISNCRISQDEDWIFCCNAGDEELIVFDKRKAIKDGGGHSDDNTLILSRRKGFHRCLPHPRGSKVYLLTNDKSLVTWDL